MEPGSTTLCHGNLFQHMKQLTAVLFLFFFSQVALAQQSDEITQLLNTRNERIAHQLDTREVDMQLYLLGHRPHAVIASEALENGQLRIVFPTYQPIPEAKKVRIEERLGQHYGAYLHSITVDPAQQRVTILVPATTTSEQLDAIFDHFGYLGHE